nr:hypothetical protein [Tanacetum cinerariifolium]
MSNTNNNMQTQTSNTLHNAIMEAGSKDRPPMLAPEIRDQLNAEAEAVQISLTGIDNDIYSTVDACSNAYEMWKAIKRLKQGESINVQDLETNLYWEFGKFTSQDGESLESYYSRFYKMMNELIRNQCKVANHQVNVQFLLQLQPEWQTFVTLVKQSQELKTVSYHKIYDILKQHQHEVDEIRVGKIAHVANPLALVAQQQLVYHPKNHPTHYTQNSSTRSQQAATRNRGKAIVNSPQPIYDQEPSMVAEMMKPRECQKPKREKDDAYHREKMLLCKQEEAGIQLNAEQADWRDDTNDDELEDQELEAHYMYMAQLQEKAVLDSEGNPTTSTKRVCETYKTVTQEIRDQLNAKAKAVQIILTGIDNDIYSTVDACPNACEMWKAIERFYKMMNKLTRNKCNVTNHQVNVQFLLQLQQEWQRFVTPVKQSQELKNVSYHKLYDILKQHQHEVNEIRAEKIARVANPLALVAQQQQVYHPQTHPTQYNQNSSTRTQAATRNRGKAIVNSPQPIYDQEPSMVDDDDEMSKDKEIDKLMALICANQDNSPRIHRNDGPLFCCDPFWGCYRLASRAKVIENQPVASHSPDYVPRPEHPPSPDYVLGPEHPPLPIYVPEPEYSKYLEDLEEDLEEDHTDYPTDGRDGDDEPSYDDDDDDDTDDADEEDQDDDEEEEEHLALTDSSSVPIVDPIPTSGDTEAFKTDESAPTHPGPALEFDRRRYRVEQTGYGITDTWDEIVDTLIEIALTTLEGVNQRVTELDTTVRQRTEEFETQLTTSLGRIETLEARDPKPQDEPAESGSSCCICNAMGALKRMITNKYCPRGEIQKLKSEYWNLKVKRLNLLNYNQRFQDLALMCDRMFPEESTKVERNNVARAYTARPGDKKPYGETKPLCSKCNYHHDKPCAPKCTNCKKIGHLAHYCKGRPAATNNNNNTNNNKNNQRAQGSNPKGITCFECGV